MFHDWGCPATNEVLRSRALDGIVGEAEAILASEEWVNEAVKTGGFEWVFSGFLVG